MSKDRPATVAECIRWALACARESMEEQAEMYEDGDMPDESEYVADSFTALLAVAKDPKVARRAADHYLGFVPSQMQEG